MKHIDLSRPSSFLALLPIFLVVSLTACASDPPIHLPELQSTSYGFVFQTSVNLDKTDPAKYLCVVVDVYVYGDLPPQRSPFPVYHVVTPISTTRRWTIRRYESQLVISDPVVGEYTIDRQQGEWQGHLIGSYFNEWEFYGRSESVLTDAIGTSTSRELITYREPDPIHRVYGPQPPKLQPGEKYIFLWYSNSHDGRLAVFLVSPEIYRRLNPASPTSALGLNLKPDEWIVLSLTRYGKETVF